MIAVPTTSVTGAETNGFGIPELVASPGTARSLSPTAGRAAWASSTECSRCSTRPGGQRQPVKRIPQTVGVGGPARRRCRPAARCPSRRRGPSSRRALHTGGRHVGIPRPPATSATGVPHTSGRLLGQHPRLSVLATEPTAPSQNLATCTDVPRLRPTTPGRITGWPVLGPRVAATTRGCAVIRREETSPRVVAHSAPHPSRSRTMHASRRTIRRAGILLAAALSSSALIAPGSPPAQASEAAAPHPRRTGRTPNGPCCRRPRACAPRSKATREAVTPASSWATTTSPCGGRGRFRRPSRRRWRMRLVGWWCGYGAQRTRRPSCGPPPAGSARGWMPIPAAGSTA